VRLNSRYRSRLIATVFFAAGLLIPSTFEAQSVDYGGYRPHYQGYGVNTPGGRGGVVCKVTSLSDSSWPPVAGTLRYCVELSSGPRFVIFEVSGTVRLAQGPLYVKNPYITIAGQTAPSPGILIRGPGVIVDTHDVVLQHLRIRVGNLPNEPHGLWLRNNATNVVVDHLSVSWSVWSGIAVGAGVATSPSGEISILDSIVNEALACSGVNTGVVCNPATYPQIGYSHSRAVLVNNGWHHPAPKVALLRNLTANSNDRHPEVAGKTQTFIVNNFIYNPSLTPLSAISYHDGHNAGPLQSVAQSNVMVPGPTTPGHNGYVPPEYREQGEIIMIRIHSTTDPGTQVYLDGNYYAKHCGGTACLANPSAQWMLARNNLGTNVGVSTPPLSLANLPLSSAMPYTQVEAYVTKNAGARPLDRDVVDARLINEIAARTGSVPNNPAEKAGPGTGADGFPVLAVNQRPLTLPANPHAAVDAFGRTQIEAWLEAFARELEPASGAATQGSKPLPPHNVRIASQ
jgi:hypothetical protein